MAEYLTDDDMEGFLQAMHIIELKLDKDADTALQQIDLKDYPERFALCGLPIVKVGISFDKEKKTLGEWKIVP